MRSERQKKVYVETEHDKIKYKFYYKRNFYGFRGDEIDPKNIKIVFLGGSTGNQRYTPENLTIVGLLNSKLDQDEFKIKIHNGSTDGKTTRGYINDFKYWFPKIPNFNPKIVIFYTGNNDASLEHPTKYDNPWRESKKEKVKDYLKSNSKFWELIKKIKYKYFLKLRKEYDITKVRKHLYQNYEYVNYTDAINLYTTKKDNLKLIKRFSGRLDTLKIYIDKFNIIPIFITQIRYDGLGNNKLYFINEELKKFCKKNNYNIIKIDEKLTNLSKSIFYDEVHTTVEGSQKIANIIYPDLLSIIKKIEF
tara:strand:- start:66 stop:983 length:918 start_codon:yes stop_codon:yes gene_type:complete